uniref:Uncharacterized protein n=1 Tax=Acrobeloides nanus TaxID=290746 RepID=A0A914CYK0_9BILA
MLGLIQGFCEGACDNSMCPSGFFCDITTNICCNASVTIAPGVYCEGACTNYECPSQGFICEPKTLTCCNGTGPTAAPCPAAGVQKIRSCFVDYLKNFNITMANSAPTLGQFVVYLNKFLDGGGVNAFKTFCGWSNTRNTCIGPLYNDDCATTDMFAQALGLNTSEALKWLSAYGSDNWECGPGFSDTSANFYCLENVRENHSSERGACVQQLVNSINQNGFSCYYYSQFVQCYSNVYKKYCGAVGGYVGCNLARSSTIKTEAFCEPYLPICSK